MKKLLPLIFGLCLISLNTNAQLIISQYVETNSGTTPKGIELYNNSGATIDFSATGLDVLKGTNGATPSSDFTLNSGTLADGEVMVIGTADIGTYLSSQGLGSVLFEEEGFTFNGDDALVIELGGVVQDVFGDPGTGDPGSNWNGNGVATNNSNIQVICSVIASGDTDGWTDPSERFENVGGGTDLTGFGLAPDCGPGGNTTVSFSATEYFAGEDAGFNTVDVCVSIDNEDATTATTVEIALDVSSTATNGSDYTTITYPITATFAPGVSVDSCFTITITDDAEFDGEETIVLNLQNPSGGNSADIAAPFQTTVTIFDNEFATFCDAPVWEVVSTQTNSSSNNGGEWTPITGGFSANAFAGGAAEPIDTWLIFGPLDLSGTAFTDLQFEAAESFGNTDLVVAYSTDYASDPCPSAATWNTLATITEADEGTQNISFGGAMGSSDVFIGIQYNDDGVDGYSSWELTDFFLSADVCPTVGTSPGNGCITCTATIAETSGVCDSTTAAVDTYTATFSYDASGELTEGLDVVASVGTLSTDTIFPGTTGTITVTGISEGTDCQVTITNSLCIEAATQVSPICAEPQVPTCGAGETSLAYDAFEGSTSGVADPAAYDLSGDFWGPTTDFPGIPGPQSGGQFWGALDIDNPSFFGPHTLTYDVSFAAGTYSSVNVSFYYYTDGFDGPDEVYYKYTSGSNPEDSIALDKNTDAWVEVALNIPVDPAATTFQLVLGAVQNGTDYLGFDEVNICGSTVPACTATLTAGTATCDATTTGTDFYTAVFNYDASGETLDLVVSTTAGTPSVSSAAAGTSGTIEVSSIPEGTDVTLTLTNESCEIDATITSPVCVPLPSLVINEVDYDQDGSDTEEFIELYNVGPDPVDLAQCELGLINGSGGAEYETINTMTGTLNAGEYYVVCIGSNSSPYCDLTTGSSIQNGNPDGIELRYLGVRLDVLSYEGEVTGFVEGSGAPQDPSDDGQGLSRIPNGVDTDDNSVDFVAGCITPGAENVVCASNDDCAGAEDLSPVVWGNPGWVNFPLGSQGSLAACGDGDADDDIWFRFTPLSENDAIVARDPLGSSDLVIQLFDACDGTSLGCFDDYGVGQVERAIPGGLPLGGFVYCRVYDKATGPGASTTIDIQHKTYEDSELNPTYCGDTYDLSQSLYAERDDLGQLYTNPNVAVKGYRFRFEEQGGGLSVDYATPSETPYITLASVPGLEYGKTYDVSVSHKVRLQSANTLVDLWSQYGTPCSITIQAAPPATKLQPQYCSPVDDLFLEDIVKAVPVPGATAYRFTFVGGSETFVETRPSYGVFLYSVGNAANGLKYSSTTYSVTVEANVNGVWSAPGDACIIGMASQPEETGLQLSSCNGTYSFPDPNFILAEYVYGATQYEFRFTSMEVDGPVYLETTSGISLAFHTTMNSFENGDYDVDVRVRAGGAWGEFSSVCMVTIGEGTIAPPSDDTAEAKIIEATDIQALLFPNPNKGEQISIVLSDLTDENQIIQVEVVDFTGKVIHTEQLANKGSNANFIVDFENKLAGGMYFVSLYVNDEKLVEKLSVE